MQSIWRIIRGDASSQSSLPGLTRSRWAALSVTWLAVVLLTAAPTRAATETKLGAAKKALFEADQWYWFARATQNDIQAHEASQRAYTEADKALKGQTGLEAERLRQQVEAGLRQVDAREDNAHDSFRNMFRAAWFISGDDATLEFIDDPEMKAVEQALDSLNHALGMIKLAANYTLVLVRAHSQQPPAQRESMDERIQNIRDEVIGALSEHELRSGITDDQLASALGAGWRRVEQHAASETPLLEALAATAEAPLLLVVDVTVNPNLKRRADGSGSKILQWMDYRAPHINVHSVELVTRLFDIKSSKVLATHVAQGFGQDLRPRAFEQVKWGLLIGVMALLLTFLAWWREARSNAFRPPSLKFTGPIGFVGYVAGLSLAALASTVSTEFLPEWSALACAIEVNNGPCLLPTTAVLFWSLVHGSVVMIGPVGLLAWGALRVQSHVKASLLEQVEPERMLAVVAPSAQAGAVTWLFAPVVAAQPGAMASTALPLGVAALLCSFAVSKPLANLLSGSESPRADLVAVGCGFAGLAILCPIGLFQDWALVTAALSTLLAGLVLMLGAMSLSRSDESIVSTGEAIEVSQVDLLQAPAWVPNVSLDAVWSSCRWQDGAVGVLHGLSQSGVSRAVQELEALLVAQHGDKPLIVVSCPANDGGGEDGAVQRPFGLIANLLRALGGADLKLNHRLKQQQAAAQVVSQLDGALSILPGVGAILEMTASDDGGEALQAIQRSRVIEDGARRLVQLLRRTDAALLVLTEMQWVDESSLEVLARAVDLLQSSSARAPRWLLTWSGGGDAFKEARGRLEAALCGDSLSFAVHELATLDFAQTKELVQGCGMHGFSDALVEELHRTTEGRPGQLLSLLRTMVADELIVDDEEADGRRPADDLTVSKLHHCYPSMLEAETARLGSLSDVYRRALECAALCGRVFTVAEVAAGIDETEVFCARLFKALEDSDGGSIIEDVVDSPGEFRFASALTRQALLKGFDRRKNSTERRELARTLHRRILSGPERGVMVPAERLVFHGMKLGAEAASVTLRSTLVLAQQFKRKCAWPELAQLFVDIAPLRGRAGLEVEAQLDAVNAHRLRRVGGQPNRDAARALLLERVRLMLPDHQQSAVFFQLLFLWAEITYEEKQADELVELERTVNKLLPHVTGPLAQALLRYYGHIARSMRKEDVLIAPLIELQDLVEALDNSRSQQLLLSSIVNTRGNWRWMESRKSTGAAEVFRSEVVPLLDMAEDIKLAVHDAQGVAMNYGIRGAAYLFNDKVKDLALAEKWLRKDLAIVEESGLESDLSGVKNKLSMVAAEMAAAVEDDETKAARLWSRAHELANLALDDALRLEREVDAAFAGAQLCALLLGGGAQVVDDVEPRLAKVFGHMCAPALWSQVSSPHARAKMAAHLVTALERFPDRDWGAAASELLDSLQVTDSR